MQKVGQRVGAGHGVGRDTGQGASQESTWQGHLAVRAAWMSFVGGMTQSAIARALDVSTAKAHRLIIQARDEGLIKISIEGRPAECLEMEHRFCQVFSLNSCTIAPYLAGKNQSDGDCIDAVGKLAGGLIGNLLSGGKIKQLGVGMGRTLTAAITSMSQLDRGDLKIFPVSGSLTENLAANPYDVVLRLMGKTGGEGYLLPVPYLCESGAERDRYLAQVGVEDLLKRTAGADAILIGIGSLEEDGHLVSNKMISDEQCRALKEAGVVCDLMSNFVDVNGQSVDHDVTCHAVGLSLEDIKGRRVIALAGGASKAVATLGALGTKTITDLVIDESLGEELTRLIDVWEDEDQHADAAE